MAFSRQTMARVRSRASQWVGPAFFQCRGGESVCTPHRRGGPWDLQIWTEECKQVRRGWRAEAEGRKAVTWPLSLLKGTTPFREKRVEKRGKEWKERRTVPERSREWKQHSCTLGLFRSVKQALIHYANHCHLLVAQSDFCELFFLWLVRAISAQNRCCAVNSIMGSYNCLKVRQLLWSRQQPNQRLVNRICKTFEGKMFTFSHKASIISTVEVQEGWDHLLSTHRKRPGCIYLGNYTAIPFLLSYCPAPPKCQNNEQTAWWWW